jgi:hypothetical protein
MKLEDIKTKTKHAVDYLVQSLESGHSEVLTQYLGAMARFHTYSFGNVIADCTPRMPLARRGSESQARQKRSNEGEAGADSFRGKLYV